MSKIRIGLVLALVATLVVGGGIATAGKGKKKKVDTTATLDYKAPSSDPYDPSYYDEPFFKGRAKAGGKAPNKAKKVCKKNRKYKIKQANGGILTKGKTNKRGRFKTSADGAQSGEQYFLKIAKKKKNKVKIGKKKKKVVCKSAKSVAVDIP